MIRVDVEHLRMPWLQPEQQVQLAGCVEVLAPATASLFPNLVACRRFDLKGTPVQVDHLRRDPQPRLTADGSPLGAHLQPLQPPSPAGRPTGLIASMSRLSRA